MPDFPFGTEQARQTAISACSIVVPFKLHSKRRHHIPRKNHRSTDWSDNDAAMRVRQAAKVIGIHGILMHAISPDPPSSAWWRRFAQEKSAPFCASTLLGSPATGATRIICLSCADW
jgi:hypothetical protein